MAKRIKLSEPLPTEAPASTADPFYGFNLMALDDDCIIGILRFVSLEELASIACTCERLRNIARQVFVLNKANLLYKINYITCIDIDRQNRIVIPEHGDTTFILNNQIFNMIWQLRSQRVSHVELLMQRHLTSFADLIKELHFDCRVELRIDKKYKIKFPDQLLFNDVIRYCGGTLECLKIRRIVWTDALLARARPLLNRLTIFHSTASENTYLILDALKDCVEFEMKREPSDNGNVPPANYLQYDQRLREFLQRHKNLQRLRLELSENIDLTAIGEMPKLQELDIRSAKPITMSLADPVAFRHAPLKRLTMDHCGAVTLALLCRLADSNAVHTLECIQIYDALTTAKIMRTLSRFNKLEEIDLLADAADHSEMSRFENMPHLKRLCVSGVRSMHLSTMPSVETLELNGCDIDIASMESLAGMPQLKHLILNGIFWLQTITEAELEIALLSIRGLEELEISGLELDFTRKWLHHLGSTLTLRSLKIQYSVIGNDIVRELGRFQNLQHLELLRCELTNFDESHDQLHQLQNIQKLHLNKVRGNCSQFLLALGAVDTLEKLQIDSVRYVVASIETIGRFKNLRELEIRNFGFLHAQLKLFDGLDRLVKLTVFGRGEYDWLSLVKLTSQLKALQLLVLKRFKIAALSVELFDELQQILQQQQRRIVIDMHSNSDFTLPDFLLMPNSQQYVQINPIVDEI